MMIDRFLCVGVLGCTLTLVLTGCGGGDDPDDPDNPSCVPSPPPKPSDFFNELAKDPIAGYLRADREKFVDTARFSGNDIVYYSYLTLDRNPGLEPRNASWDGGFFAEPMSKSPINSVMRGFKCGTSFHDQFSRIEQIMTSASQAGKLFIWSIGGPNDLLYTFRDSGRENQIKDFVNQVYALLQFGGDGVDLSFEHLSTPDSHGANKRQLMKRLIPALREKFDKENMTKAKIVYTGRYNCFQQPGKPTADTSLISQKDTDGECLDALNVNVTYKNKTRLVADLVDWVNLKFYDAPRFKAMNAAYFHEKEFVNVAEDAVKIVKDGKKIMVGMKPGLQADGAVWEGFELDLEVVAKLKGRKKENKDESLGLGGIFIYNMNDDTPHDPDSSTPYSYKKPDLKSLGKNAQYLADNARKERPNVDPPKTRVMAENGFLA